MQIYCMLVIKSKLPDLSWVTQFHFRQYCMYIHIYASSCFLYLKSNLHVQIAFMWNYLSFFRLCKALHFFNSNIVKKDLQRYSLSLSEAVSLWLTLFLHVKNRLKEKKGQRSLTGMIGEIAVKFHASSEWNSVPLSEHLYRPVKKTNNFSNINTFKTESSGYSVVTKQLSNNLPTFQRTQQQKKSISVGFA